MAETVINEEYISQMIEINNQSGMLADAMRRAQELSDQQRDEFLMPEHLLWGISWQQQFVAVTKNTHVQEAMLAFLKRHSPTVPGNVQYRGASPSTKFVEMLNIAANFVMGSGADCIDVPHIVRSMMQLEGSYVHDVLANVAGKDTEDMLKRLEQEYARAATAPDCGDEVQVPLQHFVKEMNADPTRPLIGRKQEMDRALQILCRRDKNNALFVGEAGVGKTALAYGLANRLDNRKVPAALRGLTMYRLDTSALMAGTSMRGELEKRLKYVLDIVSRPGMDIILYIDDIFALAGNAHDGDSGANVMLPYLEQGTLRFVGGISHGDWNLCQTRNKAFSRRFEMIDVAEPDVEECIKMVNGSIRGYEDHHSVLYSNEAVRLAVEGSFKYIGGRCLPDKAFDLIDEAGATVAMRPHRRSEEPLIVTTHAMAETLARVCRVGTLADVDDDTRRLSSLEDKIKARVYGQDEAVHQVAEAVLMASAGLADDTKPMASLLFVGPTGVGKTELARVLADELHLPLVRFDMSEYAERHTVSKLIGSPAGYIGYEDGGVLTDAVRRTPHCVILLDEIEKAHPDIYNTLLQVMDYGTLTDNRGQKADFRHTIILMTTNAGAQYAGQSAAMGFTGTQTAGGAMMKEVKKTFKPEFLNRLTAVTIFHDMDMTMAGLILDKKLDVLSGKLKARKVKMKFTPAARQHLLTQCFSPQYGGREADRVISTQLKPLLMHSILFGKLQHGGTAKIDLTGSQELKIQN